MKVLVTGAGGMLARDLIPVLSGRGHETLPLTEMELDITDTHAVSTIVESIRPELIINCAAYTRVDDAETEKTKALQVNGDGVRNLCLACRSMDIPLLHFSTDYVFDGTKTTPYTIHDKPNPINAYGRSKLAGEKHILKLLNKFYIVRTSWLFGSHGTNFVETMLGTAKSKKSINVVNDQRGCPTWTVHLSQAVADLIATKRCGLYNITNSGAVTWYDYAGEIFRLSGIDMKVTPVTSDRFPRPARRPANSVLDPAPLPEVLNREMPSWQEALGEYLKLRGILAPSP
jgi:dTDP-4-dehydrorhamnose reductase